MKIQPEEELLMKEMSKQVIKYFAAMMHAFGIPNFWEATATLDDYEYTFKIHKTKIKTDEAKSE